MNTQLLETLKEKWTKKSTKIACASVGTIAVLGIVGALIACNLPHTEQVVAEDGTVTTVQTPQKESHGLFDIFHAPTEPATEATSTEITPPQTNADGTPINASTAAPGMPQAAASGNTTGAPAATPVQTQTSGNTPTPAPADASAPAPAAAEPSPAAAEQSPAPAPKSAAPQEMPRTNVHGGVYMPNINCYKVIDVQPVDGVDPKGFLRDYYLVGGKRFEMSENAAARAYSFEHKVSASVQTEKVYVDKGVMPKAGKYHLETLDGRRISPYITIAPGGSYNQNFTYKG